MLPSLYHGGCERQLCLIPPLYHHNQHIWDATQSVLADFKANLLFLKSALTRMPAFDSFCVNSLRIQTVNR